MPPITRSMQKKMEASQNLYSFENVFAAHVKEAPEVVPHCVNMIHEYIRECGCARGSVDKIAVCTRLFAFLATNRRFVYDQPKFDNTVRAKLCDLLDESRIYGNNGWVHNAIAAIYGSDGSPPPMRPTLAV